MLLAEALTAVAFARSWHASWWEWHVLMAVAFSIVTVSVRNEYRREGSVTAAFGGLYWSRPSNASTGVRPRRSRS